MINCFSCKYFGAIKKSFSGGVVGCIYEGKLTKLGQYCSGWERRYE